VRGFVSRLDDTVQPYGLVIPDSYSFEGKSRHRLNLWFHGRGERLSENNFLAQRMKQVGQIAPRDTIVLHPYGRYSNAFKFAGEVDVLEAMAAVKRHYRIDSNRIAVLGFSMGAQVAGSSPYIMPTVGSQPIPARGFQRPLNFSSSFKRKH